MYVSKETEENALPTLEKVSDRVNLLIKTEIIFTHTKFIEIKFY